MQGGKDITDALMLAAKGNTAQQQTAATNKDNGNGQALKQVQDDGAGVQADGAGVQGNGAGVQPDGQTAKQVKPDGAAGTAKTADAAVLFQDSADNEKASSEIQNGQDRPKQNSLNKLPEPIEQKFKDNPDDVLFKYINKNKNFIEKTPSKIEDTSIDNLANTFGITKDKPLVIQSSVQKINISYGYLEKKLLEKNEKERAKYLRRAIVALQRPDLVKRIWTKRLNGELVLRNYYIKFFFDENLKMQMTVANVDDESSIVTQHPVYEFSKMRKLLKKGETVYDFSLNQPSDTKSALGNNSIANEAEKFNTFEDRSITLHQDSVENQQQEQGQADNQQQVVDLTDVFEDAVFIKQNLTEEEVLSVIETKLQELIDIPMDTATPPLQIQVVESKIEHIAHGNLELKGNHAKQHNSAIFALEEIVHNAVKTGEKPVDLTHNGPKTTARKKLLDGYVYFSAPAKIKVTDNNGNTQTVDFTVELSTEKVSKQDENLLDLYHIRVKKGTPAATQLSASQTGSSVNSITNNNQNGNTFKQGERGEIKLLEKGGVYHALVSLMQTADQSTLLHEMAHLYLYCAQDIYSAEEFADLKKDLDNWLGKPQVVNGRFVYTNAQQEKFAKGLEEYLRQGKPPSPALKAVFDKIREFFTQIYNGAIINMSPAAKRVYDRMFMLSKQDSKEAVTFHQDPVKNKKTVQAIRELRENGKTSVEGVSLEDIENYLSVLDAGAPPKPKKTLLAYLRRYGADYANCSKVDKEVYKNAHIPNRKGGIQDDLFRQLKDWGFMDGDAYDYNELSRLDEEAAELIDRALSGEDVYRLEDQAAAEEYERYCEAVDMAEDALGGKIEEYRRVKKIIDGLRLQGFRPVSKKDIAFLIKQIEKAQDYGQKQMKSVIKRSQKETEQAKAKAERAAKELSSATREAEEYGRKEALKESVFRAEDITELHHQQTGETVLINDYTKGHEQQEVKPVTVTIKHQWKGDKSDEQTLKNIVFKDRDSVNLKSKDNRNYKLSKSSFGKIFSTAFGRNSQDFALRKNIIADIENIFPKLELVISHKEVKYKINRDIERFAGIIKDIDGNVFEVMAVAKNGEVAEVLVNSLYDLQIDIKQRAEGPSGANSGHLPPTYTLGDLKNFVKRKIAKYNKFYAANTAKVLAEQQKENGGDTRLQHPGMTNNGNGQTLKQVPGDGAGVQEQNVNEKRADGQQELIDKKAQELKRAVLEELKNRELVTCNDDLIIKNMLSSNDDKYVYLM